MPAKGRYRECHDETISFIHSKYYDFPLGTPAPFSRPLPAKHELIHYKRRVYGFQLISQVQINPEKRCSHQPEGNASMPCLRHNLTHRVVVHRWET